MSDFSVLHEIFLPNTGSPAFIDPKLVLQSRSSQYHNPAQLSPDRKESPGPNIVPLSVQELERNDTKPELVCGDVAAPRSPLHPKSSPPMDIVKLAAEEIKKPLEKVKEDGKVALSLQVHILAPHQLYSSWHPSCTFLRSWRLKYWFKHKNIFATSIICLRRTDEEKLQPLIDFFTVPPVYQNYNVFVTTQISRQVALAGQANTFIRFWFNRTPRLFIAFSLSAGFYHIL